MGFSVQVWSLVDPISGHALDQGAQRRHCRLLEVGLPVVLLAHFQQEVREVVVVQRLSRHALVLFDSHVGAELAHHRLVALLRCRDVDHSILDLGAVVLVSNLAVATHCVVCLDGVQKLW
jgi:hypothetical protein